MPDFGVERARGVVEKQGDHGEDAKGVQLVPALARTRRRSGYCWRHSSRLRTTIIPVGKYRDTLSLPSRFQRSGV
jgi:hypothetical protein